VKHPHGTRVRHSIAGSSASTPAQIGSFGVARVELSNAGDGDHVITGDQPFGVQVYGHGQYTSYWYPGGLDLTLIPQ